MAGNGGEMANEVDGVAAEQNVDVHAATKDDAWRMPGDQLYKRPQSGKAMQAGAEPETNAEAHARMKAQLCAEANAVLAMSCREVAKALLEKTKCGDARCAELLFSLAEPQDGDQSAVRKKRLQQLAMELTAEAEWEGPMKEAAVAIFGGGPETRTVVVAVAPDAAVVE
jgi:hypothetical protein